MPYYLLEIKKIIFLPAYRYSLLSIGILVALVSILFLFTANPTTTSWVTDFVDSYQLILLFGEIAMIVIATQFVAGEYVQRTVQFSIASGVSRQTFLFAKSVALIVGAYLLVAILATVAFIFSVASGLIAHNFILGDLNFAAVPVGLLLSPLKMLPMVFIAFFLTIVLRFSVFPMASLILYDIIGELLLTVVFGSMTFHWMLNYLPGKIVTPIDLITTDRFSLVLNVAAIQRNAQALAGFDFGTLGAVGGVLVYVGIFLGASYLVFRCQDLSR